MTSWTTSSSATHMEGSFVIMASHWGLQNSLYCFLEVLKSGPSSKIPQIRISMQWLALLVIQPLEIPDQIQYWCLFKLTLNWITIWLKKSFYPKLVLLSNFQIWWIQSILILFNMLKVLNKSIIQSSWVSLTIRPPDFKINSNINGHFYLVGN